MLKKGKENFLVVTDAYSKWPEVKIMSNTTATSTVEAVRSLFASHGLAEVVVSDNGRQLVSKEFETFLQMNGVKHIKSAPYHPASNGAAERLVQNLKQSLEKQKGSGKSMQHQVDNFLFVYRNTPHAVTGKTPAELFYKRQMRTRLSLVKPSFSADMQDRQEEKVNKQAGKRLRSFQVGQSVRVRDYRGGEKEKWVPGKVKEVLSPVTYIVETDDMYVCKKHVNQMIGANTLDSPQPDATEWNVSDWDFEHQQDDETVQSAVTVRPQRHRKPPDRFSPTWS